MNKKLVLGVMCGLLASVAANAADDLSYNYVQFSYVSQEIDDGPDGDGFALGGSVEVGPQFYVFGSYSDVDFDPLLGIDIDATSWGAGVGYHKGVSDKASVFGEVGYVDVELDSNIGDVSDDGFSAGIGLRGLVGSMVELTGGLTYVDLSDSGDDTSFNVAILFNVSSAVSLGAGYSTSDDSDAITAGLRIYWGQGK